jgi:hypothetical protein
MGNTHWFRWIPQHMTGVRGAYSFPVLCMKECFMSSHHRFSFPAAVALSLSAALFSPVLLAQDAGVQSSPNSNIDDATRAKAMGGGSASSTSSSASGNMSMGSKVENAAGRATRATGRAAKRARGAVASGAAKADKKIQKATGDKGGNVQDTGPVIKP